MRLPIINLRTAPLLALLLLAETADADTTIADKLVARVDGRPILLSEIRARSRSVLARSDTATARLTATQSVYASVLQRRIEEEVAHSLAVVHRIVVSNADVDAEIERVAKEEKRTPDVWMSVRGLTMAEARKEVGEAILRSRVTYTLGEKSLGPFPAADAERSAWRARADALFDTEVTRACVERWVRW